MESNQVLAKTLSNLGIETLNDMQQEAWQTIQKEENTIVLSPTGSGKTLAFLLPILNLLDAEIPGVQCLVISPTRELAIQIERVWQKMGTGLKVNTCYGGHPMQIEVQNLSQPPALLIGTPGRILEHIARETFDLSNIKILVLDEFDKCLSMGFTEQMTDIIKQLPAIEKRVMMSATNKMVIPEFTGIKHQKLLHYNKTPEKSTDGLRVMSVISPSADKIESLFRLLCHLGSEQSLIFCNLRETTETTVQALREMGIQSAFFHGGMEQLDREKALINFRNGSTTYLVASDLAARGLDIPEVKNVIHFEMPLKYTDFVHRNGRTARMYAEGTAYILLTRTEPFPDYITQNPETLELPETYILPETSPWITLYVSGGKKDKLSKTDIVGFFAQKGSLQKEDIGKIELMDFMAFVAVKRDIAGKLVETVKNEKMKGKKYKIGVAK